MRFVGKTIGKTIHDAPPHNYPVWVAISVEEMVPQWQMLPWKRRMLLCYYYQQQQQHGMERHCVERESFFPQCAMFRHSHH